MLGGGEADQEHPDDEELIDGIGALLTPEVPELLLALRLGDGPPEQGDLGNGAGDLGLADFKHRFHLRGLVRHDVVDPLDALFRERQARVGGNSRGHERLRLEGEDLDRHLGDDTEATAHAGIAAQQAAQVRARPFTPKGIILLSERTHPDELTVGEDQFGAEDAPMGQTDAVAQRRPAVTDEIGDNRGLRPAAADDHIPPPLQALCLQR